MIGLRKLMTHRSVATSAAFLPPKPFRLGFTIVVDPVRHNVARHGANRAVEPQVMRLLTYFAARPEQIVSKEELREQVWGTHVVDEAIHRGISLLRTALGDTPRQSTFIETIPRHGYRLLIRPTAVDTAIARPWKARALGFATAAAIVGALVLVSPSTDIGLGTLPALPTVAPRAEVPGSVGTPRAPNAERQPPLRAAAALESPERETAARPRATADAPKAPATASVAGASSHAPLSPASRATLPAQAPNPRSDAPTAAKPTKYVQAPS